MLKVNRNTFFYGEFGPLNFSILGYLEKYKPRINVSTFSDYFQLMKMVCNKIVPLDEIEVSRDKRIGFNLNDKNILLLEKKGYINVAKIFNLEGMARHNILPISKPLQSTFVPKGKFISIACRNRKHDEFRNIGINNWHKVIEIIRSITDLPIVAHGMVSDTLNITGILKAQTIEESIGYLNRSKVFISSMSGFAQFASNCACGIIQIGDPKLHIDYDPFEKGAIAIPELHMLKESLTQFIK